MHCFNFFKDGPPGTSFHSFQGCAIWRICSLFKRCPSWRFFSLISFFLSCATWSVFSLLSKMWQLAHHFPPIKTVPIGASFIIHKDVPACASITLVNNALAHSSFKSYQRCADTCMFSPVSNMRPLAHLFTLYKDVPDIRSFYSFKRCHRWFIILLL